jgi:hypothetical protein
MLNSLVDTVPKWQTTRDSPYLCMHCEAQKELSSSTTPPACHPPPTIAAPPHTPPVQQLSLGVGRGEHCELIFFTNQIIKNTLKMLFSENYIIFKKLPEIFYMNLTTKELYVVL